MKKSSRLLYVLLREDYNIYIKKNNNKNEENIIFDKCLRK